MSDFKELREALEAGPTDGPWIADDNEGFGVLKIWAECAPSGNSTTPGKIVALVEEMNRECEESAAFIAAANPATIRSLLAELDEARRDAERATKLPNRMPIPHQSACDIEYSSGFDMGYAQGWNDAIDAMKEQRP